VTTVVVGAGAIGLLVAGRLARTSEPTVLLARPSTAAAITQRGVRLLQAGDWEIGQPLTVISDPAELDRRGGDPDLSILCVKGYDTVSALPTLEALRPKAVLTLQNGIGNEELLVERFGRERVISGAITTSVEVDGPGRIMVTKEGGIGLASLTPRPDLEQLADMLRSAGFLTRTYSDYRSLKWSKAMLNMLGNATAAILDMSVEAVYADRRLAALERAGTLEVLQVMDRLGIRPINLPRYPAALLAAFMRIAPSALVTMVLRKKIANGRGGKPPSLHLDLKKGNHRSEGAFLYGAVARTAHENGISAPVNQGLWDALSSIAQGTIPWDVYRHKPERLLDTIAERQLLEQSRSSV
jgi:2-dehydropantoate 2-reductase